MKRWTLRILICLILGAATTVAVAWAATLSLNASRGTTLGGSCVAHGIGWEIEFYLAELPFAPGPDAELTKLDLMNGRLSRTWSGPGSLVLDAESLLSRSRGGGSKPPVQLAQNEWTLKAGWPAWALSAMRFGSDYRGALDIREVPFGSSQTGALPLRPIFPGFLINSLFYAAIWFSVFFAVGFAKRTIRKKRGRCLMCNYDLRGGVGDVKGCPECGWNREP